MSDRAAALPGKYLTFDLKSQIYGVPVGTVREINRVSEITTLPQTPPFVAGVMNLRGKIIPVVNLREKLGIESTAHTKETCIIVIETDFGQVGMIVDAVRSVMDMQESQIEANMSITGSTDRGFVSGMAKLETEVVVLLDIIKCLAKTELAAT